MKTVTRLMAATAALGLVAAPIAHAKTRAGDGTTVYSVSNAGVGLGRAADGEGQAEGAGALVYIIGGIAVTAATFGALQAAGLLDDDEDDCISPGACDAFLN